MPRVRNSIAVNAEKSTLVFGGFAYFDTVDTVDYPWIMVEGYQNGTLVYKQYIKVRDDYDEVATLGPTPSWPGGAAQGRAELGWWKRGSRWTKLAECDFEIGA